MNVFHHPKKLSHVISNPGQVELTAASFAMELCSSSRISVRASGTEILLTSAPYKMFYSQALQKPSQFGSDICEVYNWLEAGVLLTDHADHKIVF